MTTSRCLNVRECSSWAPTVTFLPLTHMRLYLAWGLIKTTLWKLSSFPEHERSISLSPLRLKNHPVLPSSTSEATQRWNSNYSHIEVTCHISNTMDLASWVWSDIGTVINRSSRLRNGPKDPITRVKFFKVLRFNYTSSFTVHALYISCNHATQHRPQSAFFFFFFIRLQKFYLIICK